MSHDHKTDAVLLINAYPVAKLYSSPEISEDVNPGYPPRYWEHSTRQAYRPSIWQVLFLWMQLAVPLTERFYRPNVPAKSA